MNVEEKRPSSGFNLVQIFLFTVSVFALVIVFSHYSVKCSDCSHVFRREGLQLDLPSVRKDLEIVTAAEHFFGTLEHEKVTKHLEEQIQKRIVKNAKLEVVYKKTFSDYGNFNLGPLIKVYRNLVNLVVRIKAESRASRNNSAILLNCHYDSAIGSPAASDVFVSCATMLELGRMFATGKILLKHDLILLFNSAEETILTTSHAFITQDPFAKDVVAFVNLEGAGTGGREFLFQTGPGNASRILLEAYASSFSKPTASALAQDLFQHGVIPSDTDFRIFRDFGLIPGLDLAYVTEGYHYHTQYDTQDRILDDCISLSAANVFSLTKTLLQNEQLTNATRNHIDPNSSSWATKNARRSKVLERSSFVFLDVFGLFTIVYSGTFEIFLQVVLLCLFLFLAKRTFFNVKQLLYYLLIVIGWSISLLVTNFFIGYLMHQYGVRLSFYNFRYNAAILYLVPALLISLAYFSFFLPYMICAGRKGSNFWNIVENTQVHLSYQVLDRLFLTTCFFYLILATAILCKGITVYFIHSGLVPLFILFFTVKAFHVTLWASIAGFLLAMIAHSAMFLNTFVMLVDFFFPLFGRSGRMFPPDISVALLIAFAFILTTPYYGNLVLRTNFKTRKIVSVLLFNFFVSYLLVCNLTMYGFPYGETRISTEKNYPLSYRHQRMWINQFDRKISYHNGSVKKDSGVLLQSLDVNGFRYLKPNNGEFFLLDDSTHGFKPIKHLMPFECNKGLPYCGVPQYFPRAEMIPESYLIPVKDRLQGFPASEWKIESEKLSENLYNVTISFVPENQHTVINIRFTKTDVDIRNCSFNLMGAPMEPVPLSDDKEGDNYFISYLSGKANNQDPLLLWILVEKKQSRVSFMTSLSEYCFDKSEPYSSSHDLNVIRKELPKWITPTLWTSTYNAIETVL
ncbi:Endoplasmic reticulum metallopeptidase 1 [Cichlidogyrus casuarinus]|uniref:Endoplasmic reticulum metallopeptidase 1 n=1 Tax=Cichlidogyrus casuarinus TaxID=1844966 RepID=A0ABD2Q9Z2_9PLAT